MNDVWSKLHDRYKTQDWSEKPSIFAETAVTYFPSKGRILDLGAGLGQDSRFFAEQGYEVVSTDLKNETLKERYQTLPVDVQRQISVDKVDLRKEIPFEDASFNVVYAHLSLHYFDHETTIRLVEEIQRVLKPGGVFAFFVNSIHDPQYGTGKKIEDNYFYVEDKAKRFFSVESVRSLTRHFDVILLDDSGETYKDQAKGVHGLIRFIGTKPLV
jgi:SAM-dependent methyltransferase